MPLLMPQLMPILTIASVRADNYDRPHAITYAIVRVSGYIIQFSDTISQTVGRDSHDITHDISPTCTTTSTTNCAIVHVHAVTLQLGMHMPLLYSCYYSLMALQYQNAHQTPTREHAIASISLVMITGKLTKTHTNVCIC